MTTQEFLSENREEVINYFNNEIKNYWNISLKDFMTDLMVNFRKITTGDDFKKFDLFGNLNDSFLNVRCDEIATIIRMTDKTAFLSCKSEYGTFEIKKSISNILNLIKTGQWELINTKMNTYKRISTSVALAHICRVIINQ